MSMIPRDQLINEFNYWRLGLRNSESSDDGYSLYFTSMLNVRKKRPAKIIYSGKPYFSTIDRAIMALTCQTIDFQWTSTNGFLYSRAN